MHRRVLASAAVAVLVLALAACGGDDGELTASDARSRMSPMMTGVGAIYLDITNDTDVDDALVAATVDPGVAGRIEIHETFDVDADDSMDHHGDHDHDEHDHGAMGDMDMEDGFAMMGMREVDRLEIPAGTTVELVPGGFHLMLIDLAEDLVPGTEYDLTLTFAEAGEITVTVEVRDEV